MTKEAEVCTPCALGTSVKEVLSGNITSLFLRFNFPVPLSEETGPILRYVSKHVALGHHKEHGNTYLHIWCETGTLGSVYGDTAFKMSTARHHTSLFISQT